MMVYIFCFIFFASTPQDTFNQRFDTNERKPYLPFLFLLAPAFSFVLIRVLYNVVTEPTPIIN